MVHAGTADSRNTTEGELVVVCSMAAFMVRVGSDFEGPGSMVVCYPLHECLPC